MASGGQNETPSDQAAAQPPRAYVFVNGQPRALTPAEAKRARFIQNLKYNHARLKEAMGFFEHFAVVCELSPERVDAIRKANEAAMDELSQKFDAKLAGYERRRGGS